MQVLLCDICEARIDKWVATSEPDLERPMQAVPGKGDPSTMKVVFTASMPGAALQPHICYDCMVKLMEQSTTNPEVFSLD